MSQITLVLLSGLDGTGRLFKPLIEVLPSHLKPLLIPYPANELLTYTELLQYVREKLPSEERFVLLGESFSGPLAVQIAAAHPANLKALILCASFVTSPGPKVLRWLPFIFNARFFKPTAPQLVVRHFLLGKGASQELVNEFLEVLQSVSPQVLSSRVRSVLKVDARAALGQCRVPILYLAAKRDKLVGERSLVEIKSLALNFESVTIDAPHFLLQREPREAVKAIDGYLSTLAEDI